MNIFFPGKLSKLFLFIGVVVISITLGMLIVYQSALVLVIVGAFLITILILALRSRAILFALISYYIISYLTGIGLSGGTLSNFLPSSIGFLADFLLISYFIIVILERLTTHQSIIGWRPLDFSLFALLIISTVSALFISNKDFLSILLGFRTVFESVIVFYIIININSNDTLLRSITKLLIGIGIIQLLLGFVYYIFVADPARDRDMVVGTMSGVLAMYILIIISSILLSSIFLSRNKWFFKSVLVLLSPAMAALGSAVFAFGLHLISYLFVTMLFVRSNSLRVILIITVVILLFISIISIYPVLGEAYLSGSVELMGTRGFILGVTDIVDRQLYESYGRVSRILFTMDLLQGQGSYYVLFGMGPGTTKEGQRTGAIGSLATDYADIKMENLDFTRILAESGVVSFVISLLVILLVAYVGLRVYQYDIDPFWRAVGVGGLVAGLWFIIYLFYSSVWATGQSSVFFWSLAGVLVTRARQANIPIIGL